MPNIDLFSSQSDLYAEFRPTYPEEIFTHLAALVPDRRLALDLATGSGQAACDLLPNFERVLAADISLAQLNHASCENDTGKPQDSIISSLPNSKKKDAPGLLRFAAASERLPLPPASLDLVTVAQAAHWFDLSAFYVEMDRVLKPGGVLALWSYHLPRFYPAIDTIVDHIFTNITGPYWHPRRALVDDRYATLHFPLERLPPPPVEEIVTFWGLRDLIGFIQSWSATQAYQAEHGRSPLSGLEGDLLTAWGAPEIERIVRFPLVFRIGYRK